MVDGLMSNNTFNQSTLSFILSNPSSTLLLINRSEYRINDFESSLSSLTHLSDDINKNGIE